MAVGQKHKEVSNDELAVSTSKMIPKVLQRPILAKRPRLLLPRKRERPRRLLASSMLAYFRENGMLPAMVVGWNQQLVETTNRTRAHLCIL